MVIKCVFVRHGESIWNKENLFSGWTDVDLSAKGIEEAENSGTLLRESGFIFDVAFTSVLKRAIRTLWIVLDEMDLMWIPVRRSWRLNERCYGALQGLNKSETARKHGEIQVLKWRRSYEVRPPALEKTDVRYPGSDSRYKDLDDDELPLTESLKDTYGRVLPYWKNTIIPEIKSGKTPLIVAHGNSMRALIKHIDNITDDEIVRLNVPTGIPLVYEFDKDLTPSKHYYLGDFEDIEKAINDVINQGKS